MKEHKPKCFNVIKNAKERFPDLPNPPPPTVGQLKKLERDRKAVMGEYARQLRDQNAGLNDLTVGEYLAGRDAYEKLKRAGVSDGLAQQNTRDDYEEKIRESLEKSYETDHKTKDLSRKDREKLAENRTKAIMKKLAALHDPDMVAGGTDKTKRLGDRRVNSAIGGSWPSRVKAMDDAARNAFKAGGPDAKMNVKLEPCRK